MKKIIFLLIGLLFIPIVLAQDCIEYKNGDYLYLQIVNSTTSQAVTNMLCNITFENMSNSVILNNVTTTEVSGLGLYYWVLNTSFTSGTKYLAIAFCKGNSVNTFEFCYVNDFTRTTVSSLNSSTNSSLSTIDTDILNVGKNLTNTNSTNYDLGVKIGENLTEVNSSIQSIPITTVSVTNVSVISQTVSEYPQYVNVSNYSITVQNYTLNISNITSQNVTVTGFDPNLYAKMLDDIGMIVIQYFKGVSCAWFGLGC